MLKKSLIYLLVIFVIVSLIVVFWSLLGKNKTKINLPRWLVSTPTSLPTASPPISPTLVLSPSPIPSAAVELEITFAVRQSGEVQSNLPPLCTSLKADKINGSAPLVVKFAGSGRDQDKKISSFVFDFGDGRTDKIAKVSTTDKELTTTEVSHTYTKNGTFLVTLKMIDNNNAESVIPDVCKVSITVGAETESLNKATTPTKTQITTTPTKSSIAMVSPTSSTLAIPSSKPFLSPTLSMKPITAGESAYKPVVPEAGGFLPTIVTVLGAGAITILGILL